MTLYHCCGVNWGESDYREHVERKHDGNYATGTRAPAPSGHAPDCFALATTEEGNCDCGYLDSVIDAKEPAAAVSESAPRISNPPKADRDTSEVREWDECNPSIGNAEVREWWINDDEANREVPPDAIKTEYVHVIEKSAYDALITERDHWKNKYGTYVDKWNEENVLANMLKAERDELREDVAQLNAASDAQSKQYHADTSALRHELIEARRAIDDLGKDWREARAEVERLKEDLIGNVCSQCWEKLNADGTLVSGHVHAERDRYREALAGLLADTQHADHKCGEVDCPVEIAREALEGEK